MVYEEVPYLNLNFWYLMIVKNCRIAILKMHRGGLQVATRSRGLAIRGMPNMQQSNNYPSSPDHMDSTSVCF